MIGEIASIHEPFIVWLRANGIEYVHARPDKRSTIEKGWPDFSLCHVGKSCLIECKLPKGRLSDDQREVFGRILKNAGMIVHVCRSLEECVQTVQGWLGTLPATETPACPPRPQESNPHAKAGHPARTPDATWKGISLIRQPDGTYRAESSRTCKL